VFISCVAVRATQASGDIEAVAKQNRIPEDRLVLWMNGGRKTAQIVKAVA